ncbi:hypothetical protein M413DRAFT_78713 [Hebeloma cylindrosporum]|uniref:HNH nuclease domain-containing protein n=1 Tax=Hebeloma cylindrosporum TaxID=76867 RepID=A0A0C3BX75_HEBCY|nr:hypothetical protein M413DRAFT_78713 [Hebeloma cylindrosporum h7]
MSTIVVPAGHVALVLLEVGNSSFYLEIPIAKINSLCLKPRKYLLYIGSCVLGVDGILARVRDDVEINTDGGLDDQGIYYYVVAEDIDLASAIDPDVIKARTHSGTPSEPGTGGDSFRHGLDERDFLCLWTGLPPQYAEGIHILPHHLGSNWFRVIIDNRPCLDREDVKTLNDVDDIRNGFLANRFIHTEFELWQVAILKTPNHILTTDDVPPRHNRDLAEDVDYPPDGTRFTLQWLVDAPAVVTALQIVPNNNDAAFKKRTRKPKPSALLLHYNYGAAAVKHWGKGIDVLRKRVKPPRPSIPVAAPAPGPSKGSASKTGAAHGRSRARAGAGHARPTAEAGMSVEPEGEAEWDEDDVMLFFWANTPAARERLRQQDEENTQRMERWREGVPQGSV